MNYLTEVSVLMPVFNGEKYLKESIESILNQTYNNFEFIIINDGSTDNSLHIINEYAKKDNRIVVISRKNKGLVYSLNEGLAIAKGEYVARMDCDDVSMPERFGKQVQYMEQNREVSIIGTFIQTFGILDEQIKTKYERWFNFKFDTKNIEEIFLKRCVICHPSVMMRKKVLQDLNGYSYRYKCAEDYDLWLRAIKKGYKLAQLEEKLIKYRVHTESKSYKDNQDYSAIKDVINIKLDYVQNMIGNKNMNYIIWGAGNGGAIAENILKYRIPNSKLVGYIDKYKKGILNNISIYKPDEIKKINFDYVFIATVPGREEAEEYLNKLGLISIKNYIHLI
ncbi:MAG: hypothetical protein PWP27_630 [Clostridiales bacterium]|nr:hypothetical protein [Clostridiales bacterium]